MHTPYQEIRNHPADFRVRYRFYTKEQGGRETVPYQGYRSDFWYDHKENQANKIFMIHPEFEDQEGQVILYNDRPVLREGTALMWIMVPQLRGYHSDRIKVGAMGYLHEGSKRVAEATVIEIMGLATNPKE